MRNIFLGIIFLMLVQLMNAQTSSTFIPKVNNVPSSPEAALLGRFGDIPVGYYTGTANISIPLYTIKDGGIEIPITLSYHSSGIKVTDEATWVGLGWSLEPGGSIIQEVRGKPDQVDNFYNFSFPSSTQHLGGTGDEYPTFKGHLGGVGTVTYQTGDCLKQPYWDAWICNSATDAVSILNSLLANNGQPDIFSYNLPGYSGKYYINPETGSVILMDKKEQISVLGSNKIIGTDGTIYNFNASEETHATYDASGYTYRLTSIQCTDGSIINFTYADESYGTVLPSASVVLNPIVPGEDDQPRDFMNSSSGTKKRLIQIETSDTYINFIPEAREDLLVNTSNNLQRLKAIEIVSKATGKKIRSFQFSYSYFNPTSDNHGKRLKLDAVKEVGYSSDEVADTSKPPYTFNYDTSVNLPVKESKAVDFFGYYNGQVSNTTLIPDLRYFDFEHDSRYSLSNTTPPTPRFSYEYTGSNRYVDNTKAKAWILNKVAYPTGGYTEFEYEPHTFNNQFLPTIQQHNTAFTTKSKSVTNANYSEAQVHIPLNITQSCTLYFQNSFSHGFPLNNNTIISNIYSSTGGYLSAFVKLQKHLNGQTSDIKVWLPSNSGKTLSEFTSSGTVSITEQVAIAYEPGATYSVYVSFPQYSYTPDPNRPYMIPQTYMQVRYFDNTLINTSTSYGGGFRIKSVKNYSSSGTLISNKQITYTGGKLLNRFEPLDAMACYYSTNDVAPTAIPVMARLVVSIFSDDFGLNGGNPIGYSQVQEEELADSNTNGKKIFYYINEMNTNIKGVPYDPFAFGGLLQKEEVKDKLGVIVKDKTYTYTNFTTANFYGIKIRQHSLGPSDFQSAFDNSPLNVPISYKFSYLLYPISGNWVALTGTTTNEYLSGSTVTVSESYTYAPNGKQKNITTTYNAGNVKKVTYYYPGEISGAPAIENTMLYAKMTGVPVQTEYYNNDVLVNSQKSQYSTFNSKILPAYIFTKKGNEASLPFEQRVSMDYDNYGNIQQYTLTNGTPVVYLWGYNKTMPIAKIENATASQIQTALGNSSLSLSSYNESNFLAINSLRSALPNAMVTTYTYIPLIGVSSITDPKGDTITYEYDSFGRLKSVKDNFGKLLSENEYNYRPQ